MKMEVTMVITVETEHQTELLKSALERLAQNIETPEDELLILKAIGVGLPTFPNFKVGK